MSKEKVVLKSGRLYLDPYVGTDYILTDNSSSFLICKNFLERLFKIKDAPFSIELVLSNKRMDGGKKIILAIGGNHGNMYFFVNGIKQSTYYVLYSTLYPHLTEKPQVFYLKMIDLTK